MKKLFISTILLSAILFFISCSKNNGKTSQRSSGKTAELLVVTDNDDIWKSYIGDTITSFFNEYFVILPQPEPILEIAHSELATFTDSKILKTHHNILMIDFDKDIKALKIDNIIDRWATPQRIIRITSPDRETFIKYFEEKKYDIYKLYMDNEYLRLKKIFKDFEDPDLTQELIKNYQLSLTLPEGFYIAKQISNFVWIRKETEKDGQGIMLYFYDYADTSSFKTEKILSYRNAMTKEYIPGPSYGSYMKVADEFYQPISEVINFNGQYTIETHGLWELEGDFMGGPFVNYTLLDEKRNRVVAFDGYVYKPNNKKRDMMIQLEAIFRTLEFK